MHRSRRATCLIVLVLLAGALAAAVVKYQSQPLRVGDLTPDPAPVVTAPALPLAPAPREKPVPRRETFERVKEGMTLDEISRTVGAPPGVHIHGKLCSDVLLAPRGTGYVSYVRGVADDAELLVLFVRYGMGPVPPEEVTRDDRSAEVRIWDVFNPHTCCP